MPRTAKLLAITHDGEDVLLAGKTVSLLEQKKKFLEIRSKRSHPDYREVSYQESDGREMVARLLTPDEHEAHDQRREAEQTEANAAGRKLAAKGKPLKNKPRAETKVPAPSARHGYDAAGTPKPDPTIPETEAAKAAREAVESAETAAIARLAELNAKEKGELLQLTTDLVAAGRLPAMPAKTNKASLAAAILSAAPAQSTNP
jgi:hypothetical protein